MIARNDSIGKGETRVIILDDNEVIRAVLTRLFEGRGYSVQTFACPADFVEAICEKLAPCTRPCAEVLLSDVKMPGETGIELLKNLKCKSCMIERMGLISGCWTEDMRELARSLEVPAFDKPADIDRLLSWMSVPTI